MATKVEKSCPACYRRLPNPEFELDYFLWSPGFEWKPPPPEEEPESAREDEGEEGPNDEDMQEALAEMVEESEMRDEFNARASGGRVDADNAAVLARKLGLAPSYGDVDAYEDEHGSQLDYQGFQKFMVQCTHPEDNVDAMANFFAQYDTTGSGYLTRKQVCNLLCTWGEPLSEQEVKAFVDDFSVGEQVDYRALCERIMEKK